MAFVPPSFPFLNRYRKRGTEKRAYRATIARPRFRVGVHVRGRERSASVECGSREGRISGRVAPTGAWIAVRGSIDRPAPLLLSLVVMLWTAGFDVLYACQDYDFDRREGLYSIPARFGIPGSLWISRLLHTGAFAALVALYFITNLGLLAAGGVIATGALLVYQHTLVRADDLSRLNAAFFTTNAFMSIILLVTFGGAVFLGR